MSIRTHDPRGPEQSLRDAITQLELERDAAAERIQDTYNRRIEAIQRALATLNKDGNALMLPVEDQRPVVSMSVGADKLDAVRRVLAEQGAMRQADIARVLGFNSGTVSVALRRLSENGEARRGSRVRGATLWEYLPVSGYEARNASVAAQER